MGWPKSLFRFSCKMLWKNSNKLFGQSNTNKWLLCTNDGVVVCVFSQSCSSLWDPVDCSLPGSSAHGNFPSRNIGVGFHCLLFPPRNQTCICVSCFGRRFCQVVDSFTTKPPGRGWHGPSSSILNRFSSPSHLIFSTCHCVLLQLGVHWNQFLVADLPLLHPSLLGIGLSPFNETFLYLLSSLTPLSLDLTVETVRQVLVSSISATKLQVQEGWLQDFIFSKT